MVAMHECVSCVAIKTQVFNHNNNIIIIIPSNCIVVIMHVINGCKYVHSLPITEMEYETIDPRPTASASKLQISRSMAPRMHDACEYDARLAISIHRFSYISQENLLCSAIGSCQIR